MLHGVRPKRLALLAACCLVVVVCARTQTPPIDPLAHHDHHDDACIGMLKVPTASLLPLANTSTHDLDALLSACKRPGHKQHQQFLFQAFLHNAPGVDADEIAAVQQLRDRVQTHWGTLSLVEAERRLLQAALRDPLNQFFVLLSDTCIPLYPPLVVYEQLLARDVSAINACPVYFNPSSLAPWELDSFHRWEQYGLNADESILPRSKWRKSEQWWGLIRSHAEVVGAENNTLWRYMLQQCPLSDMDKHCILDEHYPPIALALEGKDFETDCFGHLTYTEWRLNEIHPVEWHGDELTMTNLVNMRAGWHSGGASTEHCQSLKHAPPRIAPLAFVWLDEVGSGAALATMLRDDRRRAATTTPIHPHCPMFARKFMLSTARDLLRMLMSARVIASDAAAAVRLYNETAASS